VGLVVNNLTYLDVPSTKSRMADGDGAWSGAWIQIGGWSWLFQQLHWYGLSSWGWQGVVWPCCGGGGEAEQMQMRQSSGTTWCWDLVWAPCQMSVGLHGQHHLRTIIWMSHPHTGRFSHNSGLWHFSSKHAGDGNVQL